MPVLWPLFRYGHLVSRQEEWRLGRAVGCLDFDELLPAAQVIGKDVEASTISILHRHPANLVGEITAITRGQSLAFQVDDELLASAAELPIPEIPLDRIEFPHEAFEAFAPRARRWYRHRGEDGVRFYYRHWRRDGLQFEQSTVDRDVSVDSLSQGVLIVGSGL